jgi:uncharacterized membrane protein YsdA (DUF1294 family)
MSDFERDAGCERNAGRFRRSFAETVAEFWPLAHLPALIVTYCLWHYFVVQERMPWRIAVLAGLATAFLLNSLFTVWFYKEDKRLAEQQLRRIPEFHLHFWELFCGWPGALYAQRKYRHKWKKISYMVVFWLYVVLNLGMAASLLFPEMVKSAFEAGMSRQQGDAPGGAETR